MTAAVFTAQQAGGAMMRGLAKNPPISGAEAGRAQTMKIFRRFAFALPPLALAVAWLAFAGPAAAQSQTDTAQQSSEDADKAKAEKRRQAEADEAARKAEARKPKRDASKGDKAPERELEEEEDI
jgi:hypothetical protein